jgi:hypothetical protein
VAGAVAAMASGAGEDRGEQDGVSCRCQSLTLGVAASRRPPSCGVGKKISCGPGRNTDGPRLGRGPNTILRVSNNTR